MSNMGPREPHNDMVICPNCTCQFVAIPVAVTAEIDALRERIREAYSMLRPLISWQGGEIYQPTVRLPALEEWEATPEVQRALEEER